MPSSWFELLALTARYWFILLGLVITLRSFHWLRRDRAERHRQLNRLPDAGSVGQFIVLTGGAELPVGSVIPVPYEGVLGAVRLCDVIVPAAGVADRHCDLFFVEHEGLMAVPRRGREIVIDGVLVADKREASVTLLRHGSVLEIGSAVLKLRIYAGIDIDHSAPLREDPDAEKKPPEIPAADAPYRMGVPGQQEPEARETGR